MCARLADNENQRYANLNELVKKIRSDLLNKNITERGKQFAFILLGNDTLLNSVDSFQPNPILIKIGENRDVNTFDNLLVALPGGYFHSEDTLLMSFSDLYRMYRRRYDHYPEFILLYSNLMPCKVCTGRIITLKSDRNKGWDRLKWFVGYNVGDSRNVDYINPQTTKQNVAWLKANGICVFKVDFAKTPSLFSEIEQRKREHMQ